MRLLFAAIAVTIGFTGIASAQQSAPAGDSETVMVPAVVGAIVRGYMQDPAGQAVIGEVQLSGASPDDLFNYWVGYNGVDYYGYDAYRGVWRPGPVEYIKASLVFQSGTLEGWLRSFGGMVDRDFFFGMDGVVYQRFYVEHDGAIVYSYFVHTATGQRSDSTELVNSVVDPMLTNVVLERQAAQQQQFLTDAAERGPEYPYWRQKGSVLPERLPSLVRWGTASAPQSFTREVPTGQPSLLELIEEEVGPLDGVIPDSDESEQAGEADPSAEPSAE